MVCLRIMKKFINIVLETGASQKFFTEQNPQEMAYCILRVQEDCSAKDIRKAYLSLMKKFHPDNYTTASILIQEKMSEKTKLINWAYNEIKRKH